MEDSSAGRALPLKFDAVQLLLTMDGDPNGTVIIFSPVSHIYDHYVCSGGRVFWCRVRCELSIRVLE